MAKAPWWIQANVTPEGEEIDHGSWTSVSFSPSQQKEYNVNADGSWKTPERTEFPNLLGMEKDFAKTLLTLEKPLWKIHLVEQESMVTMDYIIDRVRIFFNKTTNKVSSIPRIG